MSAPRANTMIRYYFHPYVNIKVLPPQTGLIEYVKRLIFKGSYYNQFGLYSDDILAPTPEVDEAVRRLPEQMKIERDWRLVRAIHLDIKNIRLPETEWIQYDEDVTKGRYLQPYLAEIEKEQEEKDRWESTYH